MTFYDLCCGTGAVTLRLISPHAQAFPMTGCKRDFATSLLDLLGIRGQRPDKVVMADVGPWGEFWRVVAQDRRGTEVASYIADVCGAAGSGWEVFDGLKYDPVPDCPVARAAVFACLQVANARGRAVQIDGDAWVTHGYAHLSDRARQKNFPERLRPYRVAERVRCLAGLDWPPTVVHAADLRTLDLDPREGDVVAMDPPYADTLGYGDHDLDRPEVLYQGCMLAARGARVGICEGESLTPDLPGWYAARVAGGSWRKRSMGKTTEWLTMSHPPRAQALQLMIPGV